MKYTDSPRLLTMTIVWLLLLVWHFNAYRSGCIATAGLVLLFTLILLLSGSELALAKRQAYLDSYLKPEGRLYLLLGQKYLLIGIEVAMAAFLALFLLVSALTYAPRQWSLMFAVMLFLVLLLPRLYGSLAGQVRERYRFAIARRWTMWVSVLLLWMESLFVLFFISGENFMGLRWQEVVAYASVQPDAGCALIARMAAISSAVDALGQWSVQNLQRSISDLPQAMMAVIGLFGAIGLGFLRAYVFSRALVGVVGRPWTMWPLRPGFVREDAYSQDVTPKR